MRDNCMRLHCLAHDMETLRLVPTWLKAWTDNRSLQIACIHIGLGVLLLHLLTLHNLTHAVLPHDEQRAACHEHCTAQLRNASTAQCTMQYLKMPEYMEITRRPWMCFSASGWPSSIVLRYVVCRMCISPLKPCLASFQWHKIRQLTRIDQCTLIG